MRLAVTLTDEQHRKLVTMCDEVEIDASQMVALLIEREFDRAQKALLRQRHDAKPKARALHAG